MQPFFTKTGCTRLAKKRSSGEISPASSGPCSVAQRKSDWYPASSELSKGDGAELRDHGEQAHAARAARAGEHVEPEGPHHELGPGAIGSTARGALLLLGWRRGGGRGGLGHEPGAQFAGRAQHASVAHGVTRFVIPDGRQARRRDRGSEARQQREWIQIDRNGAILPPASSR